MLIVCGRRRVEARRGTRRDESGSIQLRQLHNILRLFENQKVTPRSPSRDAYAPAKTVSLKTSLAAQGARHFYPKLRTKSVPYALAMYNDVEDVHVLPHHPTRRRPR